VRGEPIWIENFVIDMINKETVLMASEQVNVVGNSEGKLDRICQPGSYFHSN